MAPGRVPPRAGSSPSPPVTPAPLVSVLSFSFTPPRVTRSPFAAVLAREDSNFSPAHPLAPKLLRASALFLGGRHEPWKRGIGEENGGWDPPTWSSWLVFFSPLSLGPAHPVPSPVLGCLLTLSLSRGAPTTPHLFFLQFPPTPSSILSLSPSHADPGVIPRSIV